MKILIIIIYLILSIAFTSNNIWAEGNSRVLYISSYNPSFPTFAQQVGGITDSFKNKNVQLDIEFMDTKRFPGEENIKSFYSLLSTKLAKLPAYDAVIVADDNAFSFAIQYQHKLFDRLPIVFLGVNNIDLAFEQQNNPLMTGVVEAVSMQETLSLIQKLHPETRRIIALVDDLPSARADLKLFHSNQQNFPAIELTELSLAELSFDAFAEHLRALQKTDVALLLSAYQDATGRNLPFAESLALIRENLHQPLYHLWQHGMGQGILGGKIISHYEQGKSAAEIVLRILGGVPVQSIPIMSESPNRYTFDDRELRRFGVSLSSLPADSIILYRPQSFFREHQSVLILTLIIFIGYSLLLIGMYINIRSRKKTEKRLKESENLGRRRFSWTLIWDKVPVSKEINNDSKEPERNRYRTAGRRAAVECCPQA